MKRFFSIVVTLSFVLASHAFICQTTINTYNNHVNVGNFSGAAALTFNTNVKYIIPGTAPACPYCGVYLGAQQVISLFVNGFLGHFTILNPLVNLRQLSTDNGGPNGLPRLMDFNDESFRNFPQFGGQYFRVAVIHDFLFDSNCLITQMHLYHDPYVASMAFAGYPAVAVPIMPGLVRTPPASTFVVTDLGEGELNWQVFASETNVPPMSAWIVVQQYYASVQAGNYFAATQLFANSYDIAQGNCSLFMPGDPSVLPYSGLYIGPEQILQYHLTRAATVRENTPAFNTATVTNVTVAGSVAISYQISGLALSSSVAYSTDAVDYFQIVQIGSQYYIGRLSRFFDTWAVTTALHSTPFPQFASAQSAQQQSQLDNLQRNFTMLVNSLFIVQPTVGAAVALGVLNMVLLIIVLAIVCRRPAAGAQQSAGGQLKHPLL
eukprot:TRINITY_DN13523_c0_g1_i1.p1 TRINITY_DN13523_c0_g1~~TRINITY_DN13523_c0_g1_i1.p1  ORF type:complete len:445 (-),score=107.27 TRINITY_DN13523_c0_g1_i1:51-1355(-)